MIKMDIIDHRHQHTMIISDEPCRIETLVVDGKIITHVYRGAQINMEQEPVGSFMGGEKNKDWHSIGEKS